MINYFAVLSHLFDRVECGHGGYATTLEEGLELGVKMLERQTGLGRKLIIIGNGGSAAIASHIATDAWKNGGMRALVFTDPALLTCLANDFGYQEVYSRSVSGYGEPGDVLIAISSSGQSENILAAMEAAFTTGLKVIALSGFDVDNAVRIAAQEEGGLSFYTPSHSYGMVEISHLAILHCLVDSVIARKKAAA